MKKERITVTVSVTLTKRYSKATIENIRKRFENNVEVKNEDNKTS